MINMKENMISGSEEKVNQYVHRIVDEGEPKDSVMQGLPPSFVRGIEAGLDRVKRENTKNQEDLQRINAIRQDLGISLEKEKRYSSVFKLIEKVSQGRKKVVVDLYNDLFNNIDDLDSRKTLIYGLFQDIYEEYRSAEYPIDPDEDKVWEHALKSSNVDIVNQNNGWLYRGIFPKKGEHTITRGSFNVKVTSELIDSLDDMIISKKVKANYKFGQPDSPTSSVDRHDSVTIYFLEYPSDEILKELGQIIKPYVRGDNLFGKKIDDGFFMSEIDSIKSEHIGIFIEKLKSKDLAFAQAVQRYASPRVGEKDGSLKISEAQFYAIKDVAKVFGYDVSYNNVSGFGLK